MKNKIYVKCKMSDICEEFEAKYMEIEVNMKLKMEEESTKAYIIDLAKGYNTQEIKRIKCEEKYSEEDEKEFKRIFDMYIICDDE